MVNRQNLNAEMQKQRFHRGLVEFAARVVGQIDFVTFKPVLAVNEHQNWMSTVAVHEGLSALVQLPFMIRGAELEDEKPSDGNLWSLIAVARKIRLTTWISKSRSQVTQVQHPIDESLRQKA